jgi:translation initiation factor IF-1
MSDDKDKLEFEGEVVDSSKGQFRVRINEAVIVLCSLSGKIRMNSIRILTGDKVRIEVSPYDTSKGRIVHRYK